jgi:hypothetical protein
VDVGFPNWNFNPAAEYRIDLLAGSTVLASDSSQSIAPDEWKTSTVTYTTQPGDPLGQPLEIRLVNLATPGEGAEVDFDNVRLDASAVVPEPVSAMLIAVGVIAISISSRFRGSSAS